MNIEYEMTEPESEHTDENDPELRQTRSEDFLPEAERQATIERLESKVKQVIESGELSDEAQAALIATYEQIASSIIDAPSDTPSAPEPDRKVPLRAKADRGRYVGGFFGAVADDLARVVNLIDSEEFRNGLEQVLTDAINNLLDEHSGEVTVGQIVNVVVDVIFDE